MKKLINILSTISLVTLTSLSTISCNEKTKNLSLKQEETFIVNAINQKNKSKKNLVNINDLIKNNLKITYKSNNIVYFEYNYSIKKNSNTFLNQNYPYRIPEIIGSFNINLTNDQIINNDFIINYLPINLNLELNSQASLLGTGKNTVLYLTGNSFNDFIHSDDPLSFLQNDNLINEYITLKNQDWKTILDQIYKNSNFAFINASDAGVIIIKNGKLEYSNALKGHTTDLKITSDDHFISSFIYNDNKSNNYYLNNNILLVLSDIYQSFIKKENYGLTNWNIKNINNMLETSNFVFNHSNINPKSISLATSLYNLFNNHYNNIVKNLINYYNKQNHKDEGIYISFDNNNNYINEINQNDNFN